MDTNKQTDPFNFQYCIKLGQGRYASILINNNSNINQQAHAICKKHGLDQSIFNIIRNDILDEVFKHKVACNKQMRPNTGKIKKNKTEAKCQTQNDSQCLQLKNDNQKYIEMTVEQTKAKNKQKRQNRGISHGEKMHRKHSQIQNRKQISRKAQIENIPFHPVINNLSRKIINMKRNNTNTSSQNFKCVVYQKTGTGDRMSHSKDKLILQMTQKNKKKIR